jgi:hypothetical protein
MVDRGMVVGGIEPFAIADLRLCSYHADGWLVLVRSLPSGGLFASIFSAPVRQVCWIPLFLSIALSLGVQ